MNTKSKVLALACLTLSLVACGGGGGGSSTTPSTGNPGDGGGGGATGSATFKNFTVDVPDTVCVKDSKLVYPLIHTSQAPCEAAGGTWSVSSLPTGDLCVLNGLTYARVGGWSMDAGDRDSCEAFGGVVHPSINQNVGSCVGGTPPSCASLGGTSTLFHSLSGQFDQSSIDLVAGNNVISGEAGASGLSCKIQESFSKSCVGVSPTERPYLLYFISKIKYGVDRWQTITTAPTGNSFSGYHGTASDVPSFTAVLPVGTGTIPLAGGGDAELVIENSSLFLLSN